MNKRIGIVGTGTMARGIAVLAALSGYEVAVQGRSELSLSAFQSAVIAALDRRAVDGQISHEERLFCLDRMEMTAEPAELGSAEIVIEAVIEDLAVKRAVLAEVERHCAGDTVIASNTSSIPIAKLAAFTQRPDRVLGVHFMNPPHAIPLVEIIPSTFTCEEATSRAIVVARALGKEPIQVPDQAGFVLNRALFTFLAEAIRLSDTMGGDYATVDKVMKLGARHPMGPHELADLVGLDVCLAILSSLHSESGDPKYAPPRRLVERVAAGKLGRKSAEGFYTYR